MNVNKIESSHDVLAFIEGCFNDFENGIASKHEAMGNIVDLIVYMQSRKTVGPDGKYVKS